MLPIAALPGIEELAQQLIERRLSSVTDSIPRAVSKAGNPFSDSNGALSLENEIENEEYKRRHSLPLPWLLAPILGQVADAASTTASLRSGNRELNPMVAPFADNPLQLMAVKAGVGGIGALMSHLIAKKFGSGAGKATAGTLAGMGAVPAAWNTYQLSK